MRAKGKGKVGLFPSQLWLSLPLLPPVLTRKIPCGSLGFSVLPMSCTGWMQMTFIPSGFRFLVPGY